MPATAHALDSLHFEIKQEIHVRSSLDATFAALLEEMGRSNRNPDGQPLPLVIEPWPGGRWFRDLGDQNGHFWGHVQAIRRPTLLEITGPLMVSAPVLSNIQYRLKQVDGGVLITFRHSMFGQLPDDHRQGFSLGWTDTHERVKKAAEAAA
jgi:hypothetical protein